MAKQNKKAFRRTRKAATHIKEQMGTHIYVLPNLLTTGNMFFGFISILKTISGQYTLAAYAIVAAAIFDLLDGRVARMTSSTSKFGAEYDSLSDLISFGLAPALLLNYWALQPFGRMGYIFAFFYAACGALRLARFNVQIGIASNTHFSGLPIPMAAGIVSGSVLALDDLQISASGNVLLLVMTFLLGFVMVSNFPYRSFKDLDLKKRLPFRSLVLGLMLFAVIAYRPEVMIFFLFLTYASMGAIFGILRIGRQPKRNPFMGKRPNHEFDQDDEGDDASHSLEDHEDLEDEDHEDLEDEDHEEDETFTSDNRQSKSPHQKSSTEDSKKLH